MMEIDNIISQRIAEAVAPLREEINYLKKIIDKSDSMTEVVGRQAVLDVLKCSDKEYRDLMRHGSLGFALWKRGASNSHVHCLVQKARNRYYRYQLMTNRELIAIHDMSQEEAESYWTGKGL